MGKGGLNIAAGRREADDGKRFPAVDVVLALLLGENTWKWEGVQGEGGTLSDLAGGMRMTGSAFQRWTLYWDCFSERILGNGRVSGGEGGNKSTRVGGVRVSRNERSEEERKGGWKEGWRCVGKARAPH